MALTKPPQVENDEFKSAKWDELATGRRFSQSDAPTLALLCQWHKIAQLAQDELDAFGEQTAYSNDMGDLKAFPQIGTLKTASAEIRQLNKQLGICDDHEGEVDGNGKQGTVLELVQKRRAQRIACLITSQIDTAPKLRVQEEARRVRLITSQIDTAPKLSIGLVRSTSRLITSQIDTAPKPCRAATA